MLTSIVTGPIRKVPIGDPPTIWVTGFSCQDGYPPDFNMIRMTEPEGNDDGRGSDLYQ